MIEPVVTEVRKIDSNLSQKFHSVFVPVTAEAGIGAYMLVYFIFEFLNRGRMFDITVQGFPLIDAIGEKAVGIPLGFCYWGFGSILAKDSGSLIWYMIKEISWGVTIHNFVIRGHAPTPPPIRQGFPTKFVVKFFAASALPAPCHDESSFVLNLFYEVHEVLPLIMIDDIAIIQVGANIEYV